MTPPAASCHCQDQFWLIIRLLREQSAVLEKIMTSQQEIDTVTGEIQAETADAATRDAAILAAQQAFSAELATVAGQGVNITPLVTAAQAMLTAQGVDDATVAALAAAAAAPASAAAPVVAPPAAPVAAPAGAALAGSVLAGSAPAEPVPAVPPVPADPADPAGHAVPPA
jgi:hypothetical protein